MGRDWRSITQAALAVRAGSRWRMGKGAAGCRANGPLEARAGAGRQAGSGGSAGKQPGEVRAGGDTERSHHSPRDD